MLLSIILILGLTDNFFVATCSWNNTVERAFMLLQVTQGHLGTADPICVVINTTQRNVHHQLNPAQISELYPYATGDGVPKDGFQSHSVITEGGKELAQSPRGRLS